MQNKDTNRKKDLLEKLSTLNERVYKAMLLKEQFLSIYTSNDRRNAHTNLKEWISTAISEGINNKIKRLKRMAHGIWLQGC